MAGNIDARLSELGIDLPEAAPPVANYLPWAKVGALVIVSGQLPLKDGAPIAVGLHGRDLDVEAGYAAARQCAVNLIAQVKAACGGDLDKVRRVVRVGGFVAGTAEFADQPRVINGASDLMVEVFGEKGRHARAAVGSSSLPLNAAVEVEAMFDVED